MNPFDFLILNVALGFYNVGTIWAMEVDIFRSWKLIGQDFHKVQEVHWRKLPYWIFTPVGLALIGSIALILVPPPRFASVGTMGCCSLPNFIITTYRHLLGTMAGKVKQRPSRLAKPLSLKNT
jgi:hypothetical protein